jgi:lysine-specific demethylase/histidyl-hydroxylase NO66
VTGDPAPAAALVRCVGDGERFLTETWSKHPWYHQSGGTFDDLMGFSDVDHILSTMSLRVPTFRLVKDGQTLPTSSYTKSGRIGSTTMAGIADPPQIFQRFAEGATIVLQGVHRYWRPLAEFCRNLELVLGHPTQVNAYVTPPGARGLAVHHDEHDVFVLQVSGRKHWDVYERDRPGLAKAADRVPHVQIDLEPGHCLYLPKGTPHGATAQEKASAHLTIGVLTVSWAQVVERLLKEALADPRFDEPLPAAYHRDPSRLARAVEGYLEELQMWLAKVDPADVADDTIRRFLTGRPSLVPGGLEDLGRLAGLSDPSVVRRRAASVCELRVREGRLVAYLGDRELRMPPALESAVRFVSRSDEFRVADLAPHLADAASRLVLVRRLVREGLLEIPDAD